MKAPDNLFSKYFEHSREIRKRFKDCIDVCTQSDPVNSIPPRNRPKYSAYSTPLQRPRDSPSDLRHARPGRRFVRSSALGVSIRRKSEGWRSLCKVRQRILSDRIGWYQREQAGDRFAAPESVRWKCLAHPRASCPCPLCLIFSFRGEKVRRDSTTPLPLVFRVAHFLADTERRGQLAISALSSRRRSSTAFFTPCFA